MNINISSCRVHISNYTDITKPHQSLDSVLRLKKIIKRHRVVRTPIPPYQLLVGIGRTPKPVLEKSGGRVPLLAHTTPLTVER